VTIVRSADRVDSDPDVVVLAVKAFDLVDVVDSLPPFQQATFVTVQNGLGSEEVVLERRPTNSLVAASPTASVDLEGDGVVRWLRRGGIGLSSVRHGGVAPATLGATLGVAGLHARGYRDWRAMKWSKLIANLVGNATSALVDLPPPAIYADPDLFAIEQAQLREAFAVVRALGMKPVSLPGADIPRLELALGLPAPVGRAILGFVVGSGRGGKDPSLRLAMASSAARTEIAWLNGAVVRAGEHVGVETPVNRALTELVELASTEPEALAELRADPARLRASIDSRGGLATAERRRQTTVR
jgi:2-dehydropantoate 2-reductase